MADTTSLSADEQRLAELGYKQELSRTWSGFSNFAISFSIISILAGCFTTFYQAWNNGGPIAISVGWPLISCFILIIGFCMSELVSAFPTSGGIYWWSAKMGGPAAGFYTGWLNLIGLIAILSSVVVFCGSFWAVWIGEHAWSGFNDTFGGDSDTQIFAMAVVVLVVVTLLNVFRSRVLALLNNVSVWWHVAGAAVIIVMLVALPDTHQSADWVFGHRINNSGFFDGSTNSMGFWLYVLPLGFLLTQYTITGFDASAHVSEETQSAADSAAKGIWRSIFYSAVFGWIVLLALLFAVNDEQAVTDGGINASIAILDQALSSKAAGLVLFICCVGQTFCCMSCLTSCSRMMFAFSRDGAVPGSRYWSRVNSERVPIYAVMASAIAALILFSTILFNAVAFLAIVSIGVIGLYVAFAIPIFLRVRLGDRFSTGPWNLGSKYKWMCWVAVIEIAIITVYFIAPYSPAGIPGNADFSWSLVNFTPLVTGGVLILITIWWFASAKNWFTGPKTTIDLPAGVSAADELDLEAQGKSAHGEGHPPA